MPMDAACLAAVVQECRPAVEEARIDKIFQPARDEIVLLLRGGQRNEKLLLTANPSHPRIQLTRVNRENPANPPMFCMLPVTVLNNGIHVYVHKIYLTLYNTQEMQRRKGKFDESVPDFVF